MRASQKQDFALRELYTSGFTSAEALILMIRKQLVFALFLLLFLASFGCTKKTGAEPSRLLGNLYSGQSLQAVQRELQLRSGDWDVLQDERSLNTGGQKPTRLYVIAKKDWKQYGDRGDLVLTFFNDELISTQFYPANLDSVREQVASEQGVDLNSGEARIAPATRVWIGKDSEGKRYIGWIDKTRQNTIDQTPRPAGR